MATPQKPKPSVYDNPNRKGAELPPGDPLNTPSGEADTPAGEKPPRRPMLKPLNTPESEASIASIKANRNRIGAELPEDN